MMADPDGANAPRRPPTQADVVVLAKALADQQVQYALIGGAAMALHGYPRMTKDIDLFLPVDPENNRRLLEALKRRTATGRSKAWAADHTAFQGLMTVTPAAS